ncbi:hypothetical protein J6590_010235 [Homalodisca vitripennis]|nr:hypothetical protein J6590_010235 [Homalodisca vitripennis]
MQTARQHVMTRTSYQLIATHGSLVTSRRSRDFDIGLASLMSITRTFQFRTVPNSKGKGDYDEGNDWHGTADNVPLVTFPEKIINLPRAPPGDQVLARST